MYSTGRTGSKEKWGKVKSLLQYSKYTKITDGKGELTKLTMKTQKKNTRSRSRLVSYGIWHLTQMKRNKATGDDDQHSRGQNRETGRRQEDRRRRQTGRQENPHKYQTERETIPDQRNLATPKTHRPSSHVISVYFLMDVQILWNCSNHGGCIVFVWKHNRIEWIPSTRDCTRENYLFWK